MAGKKISELTALGANFATTDLFEISKDDGGGAYSSKSTTGAEIASSVGAAGFSRKFTKTSATDGDYDGDVVYIGTGSSTVGQLYYFDGTDWQATDANTASSAAAKGLLGVALGSDTDVDGVLIRGMVTLDHDPGASGDVLYLSGTAGQATSTSPAVSGETVRIVGYCLDASDGQVWFSPDNTFLELS